MRRASENLRVVLIVNPTVRVPPIGYGGTQRIAGSLARGLVSRGDEVIMLAAPGSSIPGVRHVPIRYRFPAPALLRLWWFARQWLLVRFFARSADVVIGFWREDFVRAAVPERCPLILTYHEPIPAAWVARTQRPLRVSVSDHQRSRVTSGRWTTVHNGVDTDFFVPDPSRKGGYVAYLGRLSPEKGVDTAVRVALAAGVTLRIGGNLPDSLDARANFDTNVRPALGRDIQWLGELNDEGKRTLLQGADALLFPIRGPESFGLVMAEALACGTPVIAMRTSVTPEVINSGETGFLCNDEPAMIDAVHRIGEIHRDICRQDCVNRFSESRMVRDYLRLIDEVVCEAQ